MNYPEYIEANGNKYKINTDYRVALSCYKVINDDEISDFKRAYYLMNILLDCDITKISENDVEIIFEKCSTYLTCGKEKQQNQKEPDIDYEQDMPYIMSSFRSCYNLDINKEKLHWWHLNDLIEGLTEDSILSNIRYIRNFDMKELKDINARKKMIKAKQAVAIKRKKTKKDLEDDDLFMKQINMNN